MSSHYPHLLSPIQIAGHTLNNRVIMGSMHTGLEEAPDGFHRLAAFYKERAAGGVGLIITGGIAPNEQGAGAPGRAILTNPSEMEQHKVIPTAVHETGGKICMQILHTGRYAYHPNQVSASALQAPINPFTPKALSDEEIEQQIDDFVRCAELAQQAGYDGVEVMGSEGYFINQFLVPATNHRTDRWGGSFENRSRLAREIVQRIRAATGPEFLIIFRLSMLDLVDQGSLWDEIVGLGKMIEQAGANIINTGIGWHEARIPTIATSVPRAAFVDVTARLRKEVDIPVVATNRVNSPDVAEQILADDKADLVCMARPFLADPEFVNKAAAGKADLINTCIACNQACLDHIFELKLTSCLVNPRACHETLLNYQPVKQMRRIAVVGAGPAGLAAATVAAQRGHQVVLYEQSDRIGGQFNLAKQIPGKQEFNETLRYFDRMLEEHGVDLHLNTRVETTDLLAFDEVILATGVHPRVPEIPGVEHRSVVSYVDVLQKRVVPGTRVAVLGAGGIGFDVAEFLIHDQSAELPFNEQWGIDFSVRHRGGLQNPRPLHPVRQITLCQRKTSKIGAGLGKTTGWIHRSTLKQAGVQMLNGVEYLSIDDQGLHIRIGDQQQCLAVDHIVLCTGQESDNHLYQPLAQKGVSVHLIGGADQALELDAKRAIKQGSELAADL